DLAAGIDPFDHYLTDTLVPEHELLPDLTLIRPFELIDTMYYRLNPVYPYEDELDPVLHYCRFGHHRGLRPNTVFEPAWYAETNPVTARLGLNPLSHYILEGEAA